MTDETKNRWSAIANGTLAVATLVGGLTGGYSFSRAERDAATDARVEVVEIVRASMREELHPVRYEVARLTGVVDTLAHRVGVTEGRVEAMVHPALPSASSPTVAP
jgi:hypothetical protein